MTTDDQNSLQTRSSLLQRLGSSDDTDSWNDFYHIYGRVLRAFAIQAGLTETEAEEVVQETAIGVARHLPQYHYDPKVCRFKTWLLNQASWRIKDQFKKRNRLTPGPISTPAPSSDDTQHTGTIERVPDSAASNLDELFERQWHESLYSTALERMKERVTLKQFQIFDLLVLKHWPAARVAKALGVSLANVYVTRHRVASAVAKEAKRLERELERRAGRDDSGAVP